MEGGLEEPKNYKPKDKILKKKSGGRIKGTNWRTQRISRPGMENVPVTEKLGKVRIYEEYN